MSRIITTSSSGVAAVRRKYYHQIPICNKKTTTLAKKLTIDEYAASAMRATSKSVERWKIDKFLYDTIDAETPLDYMEVVFAQIDTVFFSAMVPFLLEKHGRTKKNALIVGYFYNGEAMYDFVSESNEFAIDLARHYRSVYLLVFYLHRQRRRKEGWPTQKIADVGDLYDLVLGQLAIFWTNRFSMGDDGDASANLRALGVEKYWKIQQLKQFLRLSWGMYEDPWSTYPMVLAVAALYAVSYFAYAYLQQQEYDKTIIGKIMRDVDEANPASQAIAAPLQLSFMNRPFTIFQLSKKYMMRSFTSALPIQFQQLVTSPKRAYAMNLEKQIEHRGCVLFKDTDGEPVVELLFRHCKVKDYSKDSTDNIYTIDAVVHIDLKVSPDVLILKDEGVVHDPIEMKFVVKEDELDNDTKTWTGDLKQIKFITTSVQEKFKAMRSALELVGVGRLEIYKVHENKQSFWYEERNSELRRECVNTFARVVTSTFPPGKAVQFWTGGALELLTLATKDYYWKWSRTLERATYPDEVSKRLKKILIRAGKQNYVPMFVDLIKQYVITSADKDNAYQETRSTIVDILEASIEYFKIDDTRLKFSAAKNMEQWNDFKKNVGTDYLLRNSFLAEIHDGYFTSSIGEQLLPFSSYIKSVEACVLVWKTVENVYGYGRRVNVKELTMAPVEVVIIVICCALSFMDVSEACQKFWQFLSILFPVVNRKIFNYLTSLVDVLLKWSSQYTSALSAAGAAGAVAVVNYAAKQAQQAPHYVFEMAKALFVKFQRRRMQQQQNNDGGGRGRRRDDTRERRRRNRSRTPSRLPPQQSDDEDPVTEEDIATTDDEIENDDEDTADTDDEGFIVDDGDMDPQARDMLRVLLPQLSKGQLS